ncbi:hypothetical protein BN871_AI_01150 [Paenibacillus sp. P22]|nr:hypothetical protein BN871_AI_01150 [Paenibacillus sp. P22]
MAFVVERAFFEGTLALRFEKKGREVEGRGSGEDDILERIGHSARVHLGLSGKVFGMKGYLFLAAAIVSEIFGTSMLKASSGFSRLWPSLGTVAGFGIAFYCLSLALQHIPLGIAYAIWSGVGTVITAAIGIIVFKETASMTTAIGIALIVAGVVVLNLKGAAH